MTKVSLIGHGSAKSQLGEPIRPRIGNPNPGNILYSQIGQSPNCETTVPITSVNNNGRLPDEILIPAPNDCLASETIHFQFAC